MSDLPHSRLPSSRKRRHRLSCGFNLTCLCGASRWVLLRSLSPDDEGRRRAYGCAFCGQRIDTVELPAFSVRAAEPIYSRAVPLPDAPCPGCGSTRVVRSSHWAYDALLAYVYRCPTCGNVWETAEVLSAGPRDPLPRSARRAARQHALGRAP